MNNSFDIQVLADGKISIKSPGGFSKEVHDDADAFLDMVQDLAGGSVDVKQLKPNLGNLHAQQSGQGHGHRH